MEVLRRFVAPSFKNRLLTLIIGLVFLAEAVTVALTLASLNRAVIAQAKIDLQSAEDVLLSTLQQRSAQLRSAADVLVNDFAFKVAVGDNDQATIVSALDNHKARVNADVAVLYSMDGSVLASTIAKQQAAQHAPVTGAPAEGYAIIDGRAYQVVYARVRAPQPVATVALAFALDVKLAQQLSRVANAHIGFVTTDAGIRNATADLPAETVLGALRQAAANDKSASAAEYTAGDARYLTATAKLPVSAGSIDMVILRSLDIANQLFKAMWRVFWLIALTTLAAAIVVANVAGGAAVRPLARLVDAARRIAQGSYEKDVIVGGDQEFRDLGSAFNLMQKGIREREQHIYTQVMRDALTGLASRTAFLAELSALIGQSVPLTLVVADVRRFRDINASIGYESGSQLLCELAARLQLVSGPHGGCARLGADLFAMHFRLTEAEVRQRLQQLTQELRAGLLVNGVNLGIELRCGVSERGSLISVEDFMRQAGVALVEAKERNLELVGFDAAHDLEQRRRVTLVADLRRAIEAGALNLVYQPLVQMTDRELVMLEALVRWRHPTLGDVSPGEFVPLAERAGLIAALSRWVLATSVEQMGRWRSQGIDVEVAVNLSAADMSDDGLPARVTSLLLQHAVPAARLVLEITESTIMESPRRAAALMLQLRALGVRFAVDDFGTGHSSLAQLHSLPVDELKIDRAFVTDLDTTPANQAIVRSTIELGHILGLRVVAEGIETPEVWSALLRLGCDVAQGYFVGRPMSVERLAEWMNAQSTRRVKALSEAEASGQLTSIRLRAIDGAS